MEMVIDLVSTFVINAIWQVSVLLLVAGVCGSLMRNAPARHKHILWTAVLILSVTLPILSVGKYAAENFSFGIQSPFNSDRSDIDSPSVLSEQGTDQNDVSIQSVTGLNNSLVAMIFTATTIFYFAFLFYRLTILLTNWWRTSQLRCSARNEKLPPLLNTVSERCSSVLQTGSVPILFSMEAKAPLTLGARKPLIILPDSFLAIASEETLTAVVGHESAHIHRRDYGLNLVCEFLSLLVSFHPAVTIMKRKINQTREMACDELVSEHLLRPLDYARSLVQIAGYTVSASQNAYTLGVFSADILEKRIMKLIETSRGANRSLGKIRFLFVLTLLGTTAMVTSVFSLALPFKQTQETEKITISGSDSTFQQDDPKIVNIGVMNGKAVNLPVPEYPEEARRANVGGSVTVQVIVDEEGNVASANAIPVVIKVIKRDGTENIANMEEMTAMKLLHESAENAAKQAKFAPTLVAGKPVRVKGVIVYNFGAGKDIDRKTISSGEVLNGKAISLPLPEYPPAAKAVKAAGAVQVQVVINEEGNITSAEAISGHPLLRQSTVKAAKDAKFAPTFLNGQAVKVSGVLVYNFSSATDEPAQTNEDSDNRKGEAAEDGASNPLQILSKPIPQYTDAARQRGTTGSIKLRVTFLASGSIGDVSPENTLPDGLTEIAIEAAKGIKFRPATKNGEPMTVTKLVEYSFTSF